MQTRGGSIGFQAEWRRFNVAVTRARDALLVFGNRQTLLGSARATAATAAPAGGTANDAIPGWVRWAEGAGLMLSARPEQDRWPVPWWLHSGAEGKAAQAGGAGAARDADANLKARLDVNAKLLKATAKYLEKKRAMLAAKQRQVAKQPPKPADASNSETSANDFDDIPDLEPIPVTSRTWPATAPLE